MAGKPQTSSKEMMKNKNGMPNHSFTALCTDNVLVAGGPLAMLSKDPPTGFYRDGYCRTGKDDTGNHTIGATVNQAFLDFTNSKGNNLSKAGVKDGMKWCLCVSRWKEAFDAAQKGDLEKSAVPKVHLHASEESALKTVSYKELKQFAAAGEAPSQTNRQDTHSDPQSQGGISSKSTDISGDSETTGGPGVNTKSK
jgi:uncharacterized protein (DUF2237 family)